MEDPKSNVISTEKLLRKATTIRRPSDNTTIQNFKLTKNLQFNLDINSNINNDNNFENDIDKYIKKESTTLSKVSTNFKPVKGSINNNHREEYYHNTNNKFQTLKNDMESFDEDLIFSSKEVSLSELSKLRATLLKHYMFADFDDQSINLILEQLIEFMVERDRILFQVNDEGDYFYIIRSGLLEFTNESGDKELLSEMQSIGEIALIQKTKRKGTLRSISDAEVFVLEGSIYREIKKSANLERIKVMYEFLDKIPLLKNLTTVQKNFICINSQQVYYQPNSHIIKSGESGNAIFIIKEGLVTCKQQNGEEIKKFASKEYFGELSVLFHAKRTIDVYAVRNTSSFIISKKVLEDAIGSDYKEKMVLSMFIDCINRNSQLNKLINENNSEDIFKCFELKKYKQNDEIWSKKNKECDKVLMLLDGDICEVTYYNFNIIF